MVFLTYVAYVTSEFKAWLQGAPFFGPTRSGTNLFMALLGLLFIGLPGARLMLTGTSHSIVDVLVVQPPAGNAPPDSQEEERKEHDP